jgi:hypothetical protein
MRCKIRFRLFSGIDKVDKEKDPTSRQRGIRVYQELQKRGWDAGEWDGIEKADVIVLQWSPFDARRALDYCDMLVLDANDATYLDGHPGSKDFWSALLYND